MQKAEAGLKDFVRNVNSTQSMVHGLGLGADVEIYNLGSRDCGFVGSVNLGTAPFALPLCKA